MTNPTDESHPCVERAGESSAGSTPSGSCSTPSGFRRIVEQARLGDREALGTLFDKTAPVLQRAAQRLVGTQMRRKVRISDVVQSAFLEATGCIAAFRGRTEAEFAVWMRRILENGILDRRRSLGAGKRCLDREQADPEEVGAVTPTPFALADLHEEIGLVAASLCRLPVDYRRILVMCGVRGLTHKAAAEALGRSVGASRALLARARAALIIEIERLKGPGTSESTANRSRNAT